MFNSWLIAPFYSFARTRRELRAKEDPAARDSSVPDNAGKGLAI